MTQKIFVNLPVNDLKRSMRFYEALGAVNNPQFTDETAACMVFSDTIYVMLLTRPRFAQFTDRRIIDATQEVETLIALSAESRDSVHSIVARGLAAGGSEPRPATDHGFMLQRNIADPDGHVWEMFHMDMSAVPPAPQS